MPVQYGPSSPYKDTPVFNNFLDLLQMRKIPKRRDDQVFTITQSYEFRPDLLAFDLYQDSRLWWVFAVRNPNSIKDPIFDFTSGKRIYVPKKETLISALGI